MHMVCVAYQAGALSATNVEGMSWTHVFSTPEFWTGGLVGGVLSSIGTFFTTRASDRAKFNQEDKVLDRKEQREDKRREQESLYAGAQEFAQVCTEILTDTVDSTGIFNMLRDWFFTQTAQDDPKAAEKFDYGEMVLESQKRITVPMNKLKLVAPTSVLDAATRLSTAVLTTARHMTNPFAAQVDRKAAGEELANFINVFRAEVGKEEYTGAAQRDATIDFLKMLQQQSEDFVEESRDAMRAAGFPKTPWDGWERKTPRAS
jgi:hypothetical protein